MSDSPLLIATAFSGSLVVLLLAAHVFADQSESFARSLGLSRVFLGAIVVGIGTSAPEVLASAVATVHGHAEMVVPNISGSVVANSLLAAGLPLVFVKAMRIDDPMLRRRLLPLSLLATLLAIALSLDGTLSWIDTLPYLFLFWAFLKMANTRSEGDGIDKDRCATNTPEQRLARILLRLLVILSLGGIMYGASDLLIRSLVAASQLMGISTEQISASMLALGTSIPEIVVGILFALRGKGDVAIANVAGSNLLDMCLIFPICSWMKALPAQDHSTKVVLYFASGSVLACMLVLRTPVVRRWEGVLLSLSFLAYLYFLFF